MYIAIGAGVPVCMFVLVHQFFACENKNVWLKETDAFMSLG